MIPYPSGLFIMILSLSIPLTHLTSGTPVDSIYFSIQYSSVVKELSAKIQNIIIANQRQFNCLPEPLQELERKELKLIF